MLHIPNIVRRGYCDISVVFTYHFSFIFEYIYKVLNVSLKIILLIEPNESKWLVCTSRMCGKCYPDWLQKNDVLVPQHIINTGLDASRDFVRALIWARIGMGTRYMVSFACSVMHSVRQKWARQSQNSKCRACDSLVVDINPVMSYPQCVSWWLSFYPCP